MSPIRPENRQRDPSLRRLVADRDHGICAQCGCDCEQLDRVARMLATGIPKPQHGWDRIRRAGFLEDDSREFIAYRWFLHSLGFMMIQSVPRSLWEMDHRTPFNQGGRCELANVQTLCLPCHHEKTQADSRSGALHGA